MTEISRRAKLEEFINRVEFAFITLSQNSHVCSSDPCGLCFSMKQSYLRILEDGRALLKGMHR